MVGTPVERTAMVGDDIVNDVLGAQAAGLVGILVRTGKFMPTDLDTASNEPDHVIDSIADLPRSLRPS
jgi:ribonucleotide monophosphatase NagD (HAD superfamily)